MRLDAVTTVLRWLFGGFVALMCFSTLLAALSYILAAATHHAIKWSIDGYVVHNPWALASIDFAVAAFLGALATGIFVGGRFGWWMVLLLALVFVASGIGCIAVGTRAAISQFVVAGLIIVWLFFHRRRTFST